MFVCGSDLRNTWQDIRPAVAPKIQGVKGASHSIGIKQVYIGEMDERGQKTQNSSYKINKSQGGNMQHIDYSY